MLSAVHLSPESTGSATSLSNDSRRDDASSIATSMSTARSQSGYDEAPSSAAHIQFRKGIFASPSNVTATANSPSGNSDYFDAPSKPNFGPKRELSRSPSPFRHSAYQPAMAAVQASMDDQHMHLAPSQSDPTSVAAQYRPTGAVAAAQQTQRHVGGPSWSTSGSGVFANHEAPFGASSMLPVAHDEQRSAPLRDATSNDVHALQQRRSSLQRHPWAVGAAAPAPSPRSPPPTSRLPQPSSQEYMQAQQLHAQQQQPSNWLTSLGEEEITSSDAGHSERKFTRAVRGAESSEGSEEAAWPDDMSCVDAAPSLGNRSSNTHLGPAAGVAAEHQEATAIAQQEMSVEPKAPTQTHVQVDASTAEAYEVAALRRQVEQLQMALKQRNLPPPTPTQSQDSATTPREAASFQQQQRAPPVRYQQPQLPLQYNPPQPAFENAAYMRYAGGASSSGLPTPIASRTPSLAGGSRQLSQHSHAQLHHHHMSSPHQQHQHHPSLLDAYTSAASSPLTSHAGYSRSRTSVPGSSAQSATFIDESASALARSQDVDELAKKIAALEFMFRASALEANTLRERGSSLDLMGLRSGDAQLLQQQQQQQLHAVSSQQQLHSVPSQMHYGGVGPYVSQQPSYAPIYASPLNMTSTPYEGVSEQQPPPHIYHIPARRASTILGSSSHTVSAASPSPTQANLPSHANASTSTVDAVEVTPRPPSSSRGCSPALSAYNFNATPYARPEKTVAFSTHSGDSAHSVAAAAAGGSGGGTGTTKRKKGAMVARFIIGVSTSKRSDGYGGAEIGTGGVRMKQGSGRGVLRGTTETADKRLNRTPS